DTVVRPGKTSAALAASVAILSIVAVPAAQATIVPGQGIAGVRLGMSKGDVRGKLGSPRSTSSGHNDFGNYTSYKYRHGLRVFFQRGQTLTSVAPSSSHEKTKKGIVVGSSEADIHAKMPKATCRTLVKNRSCYLG